MASKEKFTPEEWNKILESVMLSGIAISAAEPSGLWGTLKESIAASSALASAKLDPHSNDLVKAVVADYETSDGRAEVQKALREHFADAKPETIVERCLARLSEVAKIVDAKDPQDAAAFKSWLRDISQKVADAATEGSFLGFGGVKVSDAEKATLADIAKSLGATA